MDENRLTAVGNAAGEIAPDRAEWTLAVRETDADPREAFSRCNARMRTVAGALELAEVTIGAVSLAQEYHQHGQKPTGRHLAYGSLVAVAPLDAAGAVAAIGAEYGADRIDGPRFLTPDTEPRDAEWGERFFHVTDPDGHELSFARPLGAPRV